jgi:hypothetical protein
VYFYPLNINDNHFTLLKINEREKKIYHYDSRSMKAKGEIGHHALLYFLYYQFRVLVPITQTQSSTHSILLAMNPPLKLPLGTTSDSHTFSAAYSDSVLTSSIELILCTSPDHPGIDPISRCLGLLQTLSSYVRPYLRYKRARPSAGPSSKSVPTEFQYYMGISGHIYL